MRDAVEKDQSEIFTNAVRCQYQVREKSFRKLK
jgi:hypothetical protein